MGSSSSKPKAKSRQDHKFGFCSRDEYDYHKAQWLRTEVLSWIGLIAGTAAIIALGISIHDEATKDKVTNTELKNLIVGEERQSSDDGAGVLQK